MNPWTDLLRRPNRLTSRTVSAWFARVADRLLNRTQLLVGGTPHRLIDVEFYYRARGHDDPFAHADPVQVHCGRWYFHKTGGVYRGGSFKGVDLTFGDGEARGGILFRGLQTTDVSLIDGPSLFVDHLLHLAGSLTVAALDQAIGERPAWDPVNPICLVESPNAGKPILACARVGLSFRRAQHGSTRPDFVTRPYRFLTEPADIVKGKVQMVMGLHRARRSPKEISRITGCPERTVTAHIAAYQAGLRDGRFEEYFGKVLRPIELCRVHGIADRR